MNEVMEQMLTNLRTRLVFLMPVSEEQTKILKETEKEILMIKEAIAVLEDQ